MYVIYIYIPENQLYTYTQEELGIKNCKLYIYKNSFIHTQKGKQLTTIQITCTQGKTPLYTHTHIILPFPHFFRFCILHTLTNPFLSFPPSGYGMTETLCTHLTPKGQERLGWCGKLMPHVRGKVVDIDTGVPLPPGEKGELCIDTPGVSIMGNFFIFLLLE